MKKMVMVVKYGYIAVEADSDEEAIELANAKRDSEFDWSDFGDAQVVEDNM